MDHFQYRDGELFCEDVACESLAAKFETPLYVYSKRTFVDHYDRLRTAFKAIDPLICYSIKSCSNVHICRLLGEMGAGFDVVSGGEIFRAVQAGGDPKTFVFAGVGKTDRELTEAIDAGVGIFNIESEAELENLVKLTAARGSTIRALLRVNPDVDPKTHTYTTTGLKETKFGVDLEQARRVFERFGKNAHVRLCGVHLHIGSPVNSVGPYVSAIERGLSLMDDLRRAGYELDTIDIGGGFGAHYTGAEAPSAADYAHAITPLFEGRRLRVILEPGRSIAANAGILLTRVLYLKQSGKREFVIVDAAMSDLIRPALYGAYHFVWPVRPGEEFVPESREMDLRLPGLVEMDVVGPICESGDFLAKNRHLPPVQRGDLLAIYSCGAYGFSMSSQYNSRPRAAEVLVDGESARTIRRRETYKDLVEAEEQAT